MNKYISKLFLLLLLLISALSSTTAEDIDDFCFIGPQDCQVTCGYDLETGEERKISFLIGTYIGEKNSGDIIDFRVGYYYNNEWGGWLIGEARHDWVDDIGKYQPDGERYEYTATWDDGFTMYATREMTQFEDSANPATPEPEPTDEHFLARVDVTFSPLVTYTSSIIPVIEQGFLKVFRRYGLGNVCTGVNVALFAEAWNYNQDTSNNEGKPGLYNSVRCKCDISNGNIGLATAIPENPDGLIRYWHRDEDPSCQNHPNVDNPPGPGARSNCNNGAHSNINDFCIFTSILPCEDGQQLQCRPLLNEEGGITYDDLRPQIEQYSSPGDGCGLTSDTGYDATTGGGDVGEDDTLV